MAFHEVRLPVEVERGASGGPGFLTTVSVLNSGKEQRNSLWEDDRGRWDIGFGVQTREDALAVRDFFYARRGRFHGFRFRDWSNYQTSDLGADARAPAGMASVSDGIAEADGIETDFQLHYTYSDTAAFSYTKKIVKPVNDANFKIYVNGALIDSADYTMDFSTGIVTFDTAPEYNSDVTWQGTFDLPVRFDTDQLQIVVTTKEVISQPNIPIVELKL